uniref:Uncharacterized protein n=1 Tax=Rhodnius prolixus TaxID=13249 RepID=T1HLQ3_RHOPR
MLGKSQSCSLSKKPPRQIKSDLPIIRSSYAIGLRGKTAENGNEDEDLEMDSATTTTSDTDSTCDFNFGSGDDTEYKMNERAAMFGKSNNHSDINGNVNVAGSNCDPNRILFGESILLSQMLKQTDKLNFYQGSPLSFQITKSNARREDIDANDISNVCTQTLAEKTDSSFSITNAKIFDVNVYATSITILFIALLIFYLYPLLVTHKPPPLPIKKNHSLLRAATNLLLKSIKEISRAARVSRSR